MKRVLLFLMVVLLLTGCTAGKTTDAEPTDPVAEFTKPTSLYVAGSATEQQTSGAVKVYEPHEKCIGIAAMDGKVVLVTDLSKLILMDSQTGELGTEIKVGETISTETVDFTASGDGITYYREEGRELVFLSSSLRQEKTLEIPNGITGFPCVSRMNGEVYYIRENALFAQNIQSGEERTIFSADGQSMKLTASHLDGALLSCTLTDSEGAEEQIYLDPATGEIPDAQILTLQTGKDQYLISRMDGIVEQRIYGTVGGENQAINLESVPSALFELNGAYSYTAGNGALEMDFYDLSTGTHSAHVRLEGVSEPVCVVSDGKYIWLLAEEGGEAKLFRWDVTMSPAANKDTILEPLYTRETPDTEGLALCADKANALTDSYGIHVAVGESATAVTGSHTLIAEYQAPALDRMLDELEAVLQKFPEGFLQESLSEGSIHISFVRAISGGSEVVQFYEDSDAYIIVAATENIQQNILRGFAYVIDSHVLGTSTAYDEWKDLNPEGFDYDYSYYFYSDHVDSPYLTQENRAFVDAYAMTFPREDRGLLLACAMMDGNAGFFASDVMQAKLSAVCEGIREAYEYEWSDETFLWEQYLAVEETE